MNNNPTSEKLTFCELIRKHKIEIPIIQRDYAQGRDGKEELRASFLSALFDAVNDNKKLELDFVYGSIKNEGEVLQPLDGQQRLTTLFLLHWFVASKESKLDDELKSLLTKFTYETRASSREFCNDLINKGVYFDHLLETDYHDKKNTQLKNNALSKTIIDSSWFFLSWKKDPTIKSMLTMLDDIQQKFQGKTEVWDKLNNISFHYIELQNFGLSDDLYIKMNARGKPLTDFENFKAKFEQHIKQNNWENIPNPNETFSHLIDTRWTDLFWHYRDKTKNIFDAQILNFFSTMAAINYTLKTDAKSDNFRFNVDLLRKNEAISFNQYLELGCFDEEYFKTLKSVLNKISDSNGLKKFLSDATYIDEENIFKGVIKNDPSKKDDLSYPDLVILFAYYQYLASENDIDKANLQNWMRIVRNLVEAHRLYFDNANTFADSLLFLSKLMPHRNNIVEYFKDSVSPEDKGFPKLIIEEEKTKARLILQNDEWKNAIIEIENHGYFKGQIGFILEWCKNENGEYNLNKFKVYAEKAKAIFSKEGLENFEDFLFERALLATGDYLLKRGRNHSFLINNERDISWKRLLRDDNQQRNMLKSLFDRINPTTLVPDLEKIVAGFSDKNDWRYYFVKYPEMIAACGSGKLIRKNSDVDILLLGSTMTSGYHKEYYSYSLFVELKDKLLLDDSLYKDQAAAYDRKFFELNGQKIAFDQKSKKYVLLAESADNPQSYDIKQEYDNRDKAILELTKNAV